MYKQILENYRNVLIFPAIILSCLVLGYYQSKLFYLPAAYFLGNICCKKQRGLLLLTVFCGFFLCLRIYSFHPKELPNGEINGELAILPDTIKVNGSFVSFEGKLSAGKVAVQYILHTEEEKLEWLHREKWQQKIHFSGMFEKAEGRRNFHGFDRRNYFYSRNMLGSLTLDKIYSQKPLNSFLSPRWLRAKLVSTVQQLFPEKLAAYCNALFFGYRDQNFLETRELFSSAGLLHLFSISGLQMYAALKLIASMLRRLRFTKKELSIPFLLFAYYGIAITGFSLGAIRVVLSFSLGFFLKNTNIRFSRLDRFAIVAFFLLLIDPKALQQLSGQISLLMTFLIIMMHSKTSPWLLSQQLVLLAAPFLLYTFYEIPIFGGLLTVIARYFFRFFLFPIGFALLIGSLFILQGTFFSHLVEKLLIYFEKIISVIGQQVFITGKISLEIACVCFCCTLLFYQKRRYLFMGAALILPIVLQIFSTPLAVSFVDVGQGDSIVLQAPFNSEVYVIDTGGKLAINNEPWKKQKKQASAKYTLLPFLKGEGVRQIDGLFLTHGDTDHIGDALTLIETIPVKTVYIARGSQQSKGIAALIRQLPRRTKVAFADKNSKIGRQLPLKILAPENGVGENKDSLVISAKLRQHSFLFTGDLDQAGEIELLKDYPNLKADVLKLGHHGSRTSTNPEFIQQLDVKLGIISCGRNNRYGHPHQEVLDILKKTNTNALRTDQKGMIRFEWRFFQKNPRITFAVNETEDE